jgi:hypothetical protein
VLVVVLARSTSTHTSAEDVRVVYVGGDSIESMLEPWFVRKVWLFRLEWRACVTNANDASTSTATATAGITAITYHY